MEVVVKETREVMERRTLEVRKQRGRGGEGQCVGPLRDAGHIGKSWKGAMGRWAGEGQTSERSGSGQGRGRTSERWSGHGKGE